MAWLFMAGTIVHNPYGNIIISLELLERPFAFYNTFEEVDVFIEALKNRFDY